MAVKLSTGLRNALAGSQGFIGSFDKGVIEIYTGPQPLTADSAPSGTLLGTVTLSGGAWNETSGANGLTWAAASGGVAAKSGTWSFTAVATGTAGWFRLKAFTGVAGPPVTGNGAVADGGSSSSVARRLDGSVAVSGGDLNLSNISIVTGAPNTIDVFSFTIPAR